MIVLQVQVMEVRKLAEAGWQRTTEPVLADCQGLQLPKLTS